jgi:transcriptional activator SPT7
MAFLKPVSKREAPNYYESKLMSLCFRVQEANDSVIQKPMDLSTMLRNVKSGRYKNKADFVTDLDLIWANCLFYNAQEVSHIFEFSSIC